MEVGGIKWEENSSLWGGRYPAENHTEAKPLTRHPCHDRGWARLGASPRLRRASPERVPLGAEVLLAHPVSRRRWEALGVCKLLRFPGLRTGKRGPKKPGKWPPEKKILASYIPQHLEA